MSGIKHDQDKPRWDLLSIDALEGIVDVLTFGARKYAARNWEKGMAYSRCYAALLRHITAWWRGEDRDPESGLSHLDHAACCIHFLQHLSRHRIYKRFDDRPNINVDIPTDTFEDTDSLSPHCVVDPTHTDHR